MNLFESRNHELSLDEKIQHVLDTVKSKWNFSYPYTKNNAIEFVSKPLSSLREEKKFRMIMLYVHLLYRSLVQPHELINNDETLEEIAYWDNKGGLCIYLSVVLYSLLLEEKLCNKHDLRLIQGFTSYQSNNPLWNVAENKPTIVNFHAWLSYKGAVLDFSIGQESGFLNIDKKAYILGEIPEGVTMIGFKENQETVKKYITMFASRREMNHKQWIAEHKSQSLKTLIQSLNHISERN